MSPVTPTFLQAKWKPSRFHRFRRHAVLAAALAATVAFAAAPKREDIEWCDVRIPHGKEDALPRVLLIGDSITRGYHPLVEKELEGRAYVGRLSTSKSVGDPALLDEVAAVLKQYRFDVIHFNNGLHGWAYTEEEYARAFPQLLKTLERGAPGAKLIWAATTPVREGDDKKLAPKTDRVRERNRTALALTAKKGIPVDDLFALMLDHPDYTREDGVHANNAGMKAQATQVSRSIAELLDKK